MSTFAPQNAKTQAIFFLQTAQHAGITAHLLRYIYTSRGKNAMFRSDKSHRCPRGKTSIFIANVIAIKITILPFLTFTFNIPNVANPDLSLDRPTVVDVPRSSPYKTHTIGIELVMLFGVGLDKMPSLISPLGANRQDNCLRCCRLR